MGTNTRPEISQKNRWWISKHRYYELRHFCLQYPEWKQQIADIDGIPPVSPEKQERINKGEVTDLTPFYAQARAFLNHRIELVDMAAYEACDHQFWYAILIRGVTEGLSYDILEAQLGIMPTSRDAWYEVYRKFFWMLDKTRE